MILQSPPSNADYISVQAVSYALSPNAEHHGLVVTLYRVTDIPEHTGIFYPVNLPAIDRVMKMRRDLVALYLRATLDKKIPFVCTDATLRGDLRDELAWLTRTARTRTCILEVV